MGMAFEIYQVKVLLYIIFVYILLIDYVNDYIDQVVVVKLIVHILILEARR